MIARMQVLAAAALLAQLVSSHGSAPAMAAMPAPAATPAPAFPVTSGGGLSWAVPKSWMPGPSSAMRLATYYLPVAAGDADRPELAVFWFGPGRGGSVDANVARWFSQFEAGPGDPKPTRSLTRIGTMPVTLVTAAGTYSAGTGMGAAPGAEERHRAPGRDGRGAERGRVLQAHRPAPERRGRREGFRRARREPQALKQGRPRNVTGS